MPIQIKDPIQAPAIVAKEISGFSVNLVSMRCDISFVSFDETGKVAGEESHNIPLLADGAPRFTPEEYASIKAALYRLALEDGVVAGAVS